MAGISAALVVLGTLAACAPPDRVDEVVPESAAAAETAPTEAPSPVVLDAGVIVATGELRSADSLSSGRVSVVSSGDGWFDLVIDGFSSPVTAISVSLATEPFSEELYCEVTQVIYGFGDVDPASRIVMPMDFGSFELMHDPSFFDTLLLVNKDADAPRTGCFYPVLASADLTWTMPDVRPDIRVVDSGSTGGATGTVELDGDRPLSYSVAPGDVMEEIAGRFGITVADIFWLSPTRRPNQQDPQAYAFEVLNLDKAARATS